MTGSRMAPRGSEPVGLGGLPGAGTGAGAEVPVFGSEQTEYQILARAFARRFAIGAHWRRGRCRGGPYFFFVGSGGGHMPARSKPSRISRLASSVVLLTLRPASRSSASASSSRTRSIRPGRFGSVVLARLRAMPSGVAVAVGIGNTRNAEKGKSAHSDFTGGYPNVNKFVTNG